MSAEKFGQSTGGQNSPSVSTIGGDLTITGNVTSKGGIQLDGHVPQIVIGVSRAVPSSPPWTRSRWRSTARPARSYREQLDTFHKLLLGTILHARMGHPWVSGASTHRVLFAAWNRDDSLR
jgi:hypothetical protein